MTTLETHQPLNRPIPTEKEEGQTCRFTTDMDAAFFVSGLLFDDKRFEKELVILADTKL